MEKSNRAVILLLILISPCFTATANADLAITEIMSQSDHSGGTDFDWWELTNTSSSSVDLTGYSWDDLYAHGAPQTPVPGTNVFGNVSIAPNESILILCTDADEALNLTFEWDLYNKGVNTYNMEEHFTAGFPGSGLGDPDGVVLFDAGEVFVTSVEYPSRTTGFSNEWDTSGAFLSLSVIGENGAYQSTNSNPDIASPGYAVPEPAMILVFGLGGIALRRKRRG
jgi:hypothetical protein